MSLFVMAQILSTNATRIKRCGLLVAWTFQDYILSKAGLVIPIFYSSLLSILLSTSMVSSTSSKNPHGCGGLAKKIMCTVIYSIQQITYHKRINKTSVSIVCLKSIFFSNYQTYPNGPTHCLIGISNLSEASPVQVPFVESKNFRVNNFFGENNLAACEKMLGMTKKL